MPFESASKLIVELSFNNFPDNNFLPVISEIVYPTAWLKSFTLIVTRLFVGFGNTEIILASGLIENVLKQNCKHYF